MNTGRIKKIFLVLGDIAVFYLALLLTLYFRYDGSWTNQWYQHFNSFSIIYLLWLVVFYISGLYDLNLARNNINFFATLSKTFLINAALAIAFFYFIPYFGITPKTNLFINLVVFSLLFVLWRQVYNFSIKSPSFLNNVLILGQSKEAKELAAYVKENPQLGYRIEKIADPEEVKILSDLIKLVVKEKIGTIITTASPHHDAVLVRNLYHCLPLKIVVSDLPAFYEKITGKIPVSSIEETWFLENLMCGQRNIFEGTKRLADLILASLGLAISLVIAPFLMLAIKLDSPGPIFIRQKRVGQDNQIYNFIKFRSMYALAPDGSAEMNGAEWFREKEDRITRVGKFIRKTRLDEIPQLWNILKGDMSFVGPRPERPEFAFSNELLSKIPFYQVRHTIKPGLTGWAQIKYRHVAGIEDTLQKLQYDLFYIKNRSFFLDLGIILKTVKIIFSAAGR